VDPFLNLSYIIPNNDKSSISPKCDHLGSPTCCASVSHGSPFPTNHDSMMVVNHDINNKDCDEGDMTEAVIHKKVYEPNC